MKRIVTLLLAIITVMTAAACGKVIPPVPPIKQTKMVKAVAVANVAEIKEEEIPLHKQVDIFIEAFKNGDSDTIEKLLKAKAGTYKSWQTAKISDVKISVVKETPFFGQYLVNFYVSDKGMSSFHYGENKRVLVTGDAVDRTGIIGFYDQKCLPLSAYDGEGLGRVMERSEAEVNQLITHYGISAFTNAKTLPPDLLVSYAIMKIGEQNFKDGGSFVCPSPSAEKVKLFLWKHLSLTDYDVAQSSFYDKETGKFSVEPIPVETYSRVIDGHENSDGSYSVLVQAYYDPICANPSTRFTYKLIKNEDRTFKIVLCSMDHTWNK